MPKLRSLLAAVLVAATAACSENPASAPDTGRMTGVLDGATWKGEAYAGIYKDSLYVGSTRDRAEQHVSANVAFAGVGRYDIAPGAGRYSETVGQDVLTYQAAATGGTLIVESYNEATGAISGSLEITTQGSRGVTRFQGGEFVTRVQRIP